MRVISQNEQFDFPYGQIVITCDGNRVTCKPAHEMSGRYYLLGEYSTEEKAQKSMEMLRHAQMFNFILSNRIVPAKELVEMSRVSELIPSNGFLIPPEEYDDSLLKGYFQFPKDSEV